MPSKKWLAARVTALAGLACMWVQDGSWQDGETIMAITVVSAAALAWLIPNGGEEVTP